MITNISNGKPKKYIDDADAALSASIVAETNNRAAADSVLQDGIDSKAPISHASSGTGYGAATSSMYGHVKVDTSISGTSANPVQNQAIKAALDLKQDDLTFDTAPTSGSTNPVTSNGIKAAIDTLENSLGTAAYKDAGTSANQVLQLDSNGKVPAGVYDNYPISEYVGTVSSLSALTTLSAAQKGDYAVVTGSGDSSVDGTYMLNGTYSTQADWIRISTPDAAWGNISGTLDSQTDLRQALDAKQDVVVAGTGIVKGSDGKTLSLGASGVFPRSRGSDTQIPILTVDTYGRVTAIGGVAVYPPTSEGSAYQYWRSDGSKTGVWQSPDTSPASGSSVALTSGAAYTALAGKQANIVKLSVSVATGAWSASTKQATVRASGVTAAGTLIVGPAYGSEDVWQNAGMMATAQAANTITLSCDTVPTADATIAVIMIP